MQVEQLTIVGVGLIGGSVGLAAKARGVARRVVGVGRDERTLARAQAGGAIDSYTTDLREAAAASDLVVVCTPVDRVAADVLAAAAVAPAGCIITDVGSTKVNIVREVERHIPDHVRFVGGHPIAGSEKAGAENARADLFVGRLTVLTHAEEEALFAVTHFWQALGSEVTHMSPDNHDLLLAFTSHLPHAVASGLAGLLEEGDLEFSAGGLRDTTRIAAGDPDLWAAIFRANREAVLSAIDKFTDRMNQFRQFLAADDRAGLVRWLAEGKRVRDALGS